MNNAALIGVARRLSILFYFPAVIGFFAVMFPASVFIWLATGKTIDDVMDFFENKNADYWEWVKA
jgi:hypothetical protein